MPGVGNHIAHGDALTHEFCVGNGCSTSVAYYYLSIQ